MGQKCIIFGAQRSEVKSRTPPNGSEHYCKRSHEFELIKCAFYETQTGVNLVV